MIWHYRIHPRRPLAEFLPKALARANADSSILHVRRGVIDSLLFCTSSRLAENQRRRHHEGGAFSASFCSIDLIPLHGVAEVNQEGSDDSVEQMKPFIVWMLNELGPCDIRDSQTGHDLTERVTNDPWFLFD